MFPVTTRACLTLVLILMGILPGIESVDARSLWLSPGSSETSLVADLKASAIGDIVTVIVRETTRTANSQTTDTSKESAVSASVSQYLFPTSASSFGTHNGALPGTGFGGSSEHSGGGSITNNQTFTTQFSVRVIDRLPNRQLVLEGVRVVLVSGERHFLVLTGVIRPADISSDNTILSSRIADARIEFISEGTLTEVQRKGWLQKLNDLLTPF